MNYAGITQLVVDTLKDDDVATTQAQTFIDNFEQTLDGDLLDRSYGKEVPRQMLARIDDTTDSNSALTLPSGFLRARSVTINGAPSRYTGPEKVPTAASGFGDAPVTLDYYKSVPRLAASSTNWVGDLSHTVYLWGACLQYIPWAHRYDNLQTWTGFYTAAIKALKKATSMRPGGGWMSFKGRPYSSFYTVIGDQMIFTGPVRRTPI